MERKYKKIYEFKQILKLWAEYRKRTNRGTGNPQEPMMEMEKLCKESGIEFTRKTYSGNIVPNSEIRYAYIAYGLLRGKQYIQIERPRTENELYQSQWKYIKQLMDHFTEKVEEPVNA